MKKNVMAFMLLALVSVGCKKETVKPTTDASELQEVPLTEKASYEYKLEWTAFKTPEKTGVKGTFDGITLNGIKDTGSVEQDLKDATFSIETSTVNTTDPMRDAKLKDGFFALMTGGTITGKFVDFKEGKAIIELTMNGVTVEKHWEYTAKEQAIDIKGSIDILKDFKGDKPFAQLHELCKDLHEGKTWTDVDVAVQIFKK